jgi:hypothetical protein
VCCWVQGIWWEKAAQVPVPVVRLQENQEAQNSCCSGCIGGCGASKRGEQEATCELKGTGHGARRRGRMGSVSQTQSMHKGPEVVASMLSEEPTWDGA